MLRIRTALEIPLSMKRGDSCELIWCFVMPLFWVETRFIRGIYTLEANVKDLELSGGLYQ